MLLYFDNQMNFISILSLICFPLMPQSINRGLFSYCNCDFRKKLPLRFRLWILSLIRNKARNLWFSKLIKERVYFKCASFQALKRRV